MLKPDLHPQENIRLNVLHNTGSFNSMEESEYENFVVIASALTETPIALLSITDQGRQWFKAKVGLNISEVTRDVSFCGHAILTADTKFIVEDAMYDMRFCDNPMVMGDPGIRFYAGIPIRLAKERMPIGTICVLDKKPRKLSADKIAGLVALGELLELYISNKVAVAQSTTPPSHPSVMKR